MRALLGDVRGGRCGPVATFLLGNSVLGIAFDGANMWVVGNQSVTELSPAGARLGTFVADAAEQRRIVCCTNRGRVDLATHLDPLPRRGPPVVPSRA